MEDKTKEAAKAEKKETKKAEKQTAQKDKKVAKKQGNVFVKIGKEVLSKHDELDQVYVTSDGYPFASESDAKNNAANLSDKTIVKVTRAELTADADELPATEGGSEENQATEDSSEGEGDREL